MLFDEQIIVPQMQLTGTASIENVWLLDLLLTNLNLQMIISAKFSAQAAQIGVKDLKVFLENVYYSPLLNKKTVTFILFRKNSPLLIK